MSSTMHINPYRAELYAENEKDVCIMLHGLFGMSSNLLSLAKGISSVVYPLSLDLPNHGESPAMSPCNFIKMAESLYKTIEELGFEDDVTVHFLGHSLGAKLAMTYALLYPEATASLLIMDIAPVTYPPFHLDLLKAFYEIEDTNPTNRDEVVRIISKYEDDVPTAVFLAKSFLFEEGKYAGSKIRFREIEKNYDVLRSFPSEELSGKTYTKPTLVMRAEETEYFSDEYAYKIDKYFPSWEIETIENSGHNIHVDNPQDVKEFIQGFYTEIKS